MSNPHPSADASRIAALEAEVAALERQLAASKEVKPAGEARGRLVEFLEYTPDAIFIKDPQGRYTNVSNTFLALAGKTLEQVIGRTDDELFEPKLAASFKGQDEAVRASGAPAHFEDTLDYQGRALNFLTRKFLLPTGEVAGIASDVTAQRAAQRLHQDTERRLELALEGTGIGVFENDLSSGFGQWSPSGFRILGVEPPPALIGSYALWRERVHPDDVERAEAAHEAARTRGGPWSMEFRIVRKDSGEVRWLSAYGQFTHRDGTTISTGAALDITEQKQSQERLAEQARTLETLNQVGAVVGAELDLGTIVQKVTDAGVELTGARFGAFFYNLSAESGEMLTLYTLSGAKRSDFDQFPHPRATQIFKPTFDGTEIVRSDDITKDSRYGHNAPTRGCRPTTCPSAAISRSRSSHDRAK
ncbi:MAG: PAS domain S-box protein [Sphingomicrobium sp.]